jgi:diadenosine tetraphosphatase ApaH/serine/threonine PP2A family protein phosphatase
MLRLGAHRPAVPQIAGVRFVNAGSAGKPTDGDRPGGTRAAWALVDLAPGRPVAVEIHRVAYDVAAMPAAIRAADGLPDEFARDLETGGR